MVLELNKSNITSYLKKRKIIAKDDSPKIKELSGGNVNRLFLVKTKSSAFVIKQTTPEAVNFPGIDISEERSKYEIAAIKLINNIFKKETKVPQLLFEDAKNNIFAMSLIPQEAVLYQTELMEGRFHFDIVTQLAKFTGKLHSKTYNNPQLRKYFAENPGYKLREITTTTAFDRYPELKRQFAAAFNKNYKNRLCFIDADITPKNILIHNNTFTKVDFDACTYGDPAHELGIILAHFLLPAIINPQWKKEYLQCTKLFYNTYSKHCSYPLPDKFFMNMKNYLVLMMIGRVDSIFTFPWLKEKEDIVRKIAIEIFTNDCKDVDQLLKQITPFFSK
ncbi:aminoglycoside phosphotransferase family protein [Candidatus Woesearchaeota archaeon]|nr:aminoglycoside phosphotransferase family protein [Candidatus Woesearchaeota archaeon]